LEPFNVVAIFSLRAWSKVRAKSKPNTQPKGWPLVLFGQQKVPKN
jgi:hypothetical protein